MNIEKLIRKNVLKLKPYSSARDDFKEHADIYLDANENPFGNDLNRYPDPYQKKLKNALAEIKGISPDLMLLGNGSDEVLDLIFRAFCEPGEDNVIIAPPTYGMYKVLAEVNNVEVKEVLLNKDFSLNTGKMISSADMNTKLVLLASPNNPTGNLFKKNDILQLLEKMNCLIVIDEAYIDFSDRGSWLDDLKNYPQLIVTQTLSKAWGLAGIRLGMCFASPKIIEVLNKIKPPYNVSQLSQEHALERIKDDVTLKRNLKVLREEKETIKEGFKDLSYVQKIYPSDANFWLVKVRNAPKIFKGLMNQGIVVRDRSKEPLCENCLRITTGTPEENKRLLKTLKLLDN
jgi:histidinol-phosphate aminotransferase